MIDLFTPYWVALIAVLKGDADLNQRAKYIGEQPNGAVEFPLIWTEEPSNDDWSTKTEDGISATVALHIGSRYNGTAEIRQLKKRVYELLNNQPLTLSEGKAVLVVYEGDRTFFDDDGVTRHCVMQFNVIVCED